MYEKNIEVYMIFNCIRDVWTSLKIEILFTVEREIRTIDPMVCEVKPSSYILSQFLLLQLLFSLLLFGVPCVLFFFAALHTKLMLLWGEAMTELYAAVRCSRVAPSSGRRQGCKWQ